MLEQSEYLIDLIATIYDAALGVGSWESTLERTCAFLNCATVALGSFDLSRHNTNLTKPWGYKSGYLATYRDHYRKVAPLVVRAHGAAIGAAVSICDVMRYDEFKQTMFYREWTKPQGHVDALKVNLAKSATDVTFILGSRHQSAGMVDDEMRRRMHLLWPHFRRAILIREAGDLQKVEAAALADAVDALATAVFLVNADARIVHANASGHALVDNKTVLSSVNGRLIANEAQANASLRRALVAADGGDLELGVKGFAVPLSGDERVVARVLPLTAGKRRRAGAEYSAVAAIFVPTGVFEQPHPFESIATVYQLTPAELRVLTAVVNVGGAPEIALALGISENTVKTHLRRVFNKTGTSRQADLVKLVAAHWSALC